jgi:hypothetical protein
MSSSRLIRLAVVATLAATAAAPSFARGFTGINFTLPTAAQLAALLQNAVWTPFTGGSVAPAAGSTGSNGVCGTTFSASSSSNNGSGSSVSVSSAAYSSPSGQCTTSTSVTVRP